MHTGGILQDSQDLVRWTALLLEEEGIQEEQVGLLANGRLNLGGRRTNGGREEDQQGEGGGPTGGKV